MKDTDEDSELVPRSIVLDSGIQRTLQFYDPIQDIASGMRFASSLYPPIADKVLPFLDLDATQLMYDPFLQMKESMELFTSVSDSIADQISSFVNFDATQLMYDPFLQMKESMELFTSVSDSIADQISSFVNFDATQLMMSSQASLTSLDHQGSLTLGHGSSVDLQPFSLLRNQTEDSFRISVIMDDYKFNLLPIQQLVDNIKESLNPRESSGAIELRHSAALDMSGTSLIRLEFIGSVLFGVVALGSITIASTRLDIPLVWLLSWILNIVALVNLSRRFGKWWSSTTVGETSVA